MCAYVRINTTAYQRSLNVCNVMGDRDRERH
jgi:hypothetical protein